MLVRSSLIGVSIASPFAQVLTERAAQPPTPSLSSHSFAAQLKTHPA